MAGGGVYPLFLANFRLFNILHMEGAAKSISPLFKIPGSGTSYVWE